VIFMQRVAISNHLLKKFSPKKSLFIKITHLTLLQQIIKGIIYE